MNKSNINRFERRITSVERRSAETFCTVSRRFLRLIRELKLFSPLFVSICGARIFARVLHRYFIPFPMCVLNVAGNAKRQNKLFEVKFP